MDKIMEIEFRNHKKYDIFLNTGKGLTNHWYEARYSSFDPPGQFCTQEDDLHELISKLVEFELMVNKKDKGDDNNGKQ